VAGIALRIHVRGICGMAAFAVNVFMFGTGVIVQVAVTAEFAIFRWSGRIPEGNVRMYKRRITSRIVAFLTNHIYPKLFCWRVFMTIVTAVRVNRKWVFGIIMTDTAIVFNQDMTTVALITGFGCPALTGPRWNRIRKGIG